MLTNEDIKKIELAKSFIEKHERSLNHALEEFDYNNSYYLEKSIATDPAASLALEAGINILDKVNGWIGDKISDWTVNGDSKIYGRASAGYDSSAKAARSKLISQINDKVKSIKDEKSYKLKASPVLKPVANNLNALVKLVKEMNGLSDDMASGFKMTSAVLKDSLKIIEEMKQDSSYDVKEYIPKSDKLFESILEVTKKYFPVETPDGKNTIHYSRRAVNIVPGVITGSNKPGYNKVARTQEINGGEKIDITISGKEIKDLLRVLLNQAAANNLDKVSGDMILVEKASHKYSTNYIALSAPRKIKLGDFYFSLIVTVMQAVDCTAIPLIRCFKTETAILEAINKAI